MWASHPVGGGLSSLQGMADPKFWTRGRVHRGRADRVDPGEATCRGPFSPGRGHQGLVGGAVDSRRVSDGRGLEWSSFHPMIKAVVPGLEPFPPTRGESSPDRQVAEVCTASEADSQVWAGTSVGPRVCCPFVLPHVRQRSGDPTRGSTLPPVLGTTFGGTHVLGTVVDAPCPMAFSLPMGQALHTLFANL